MNQVEICFKQFFNIIKKVIFFATIMTITCHCRATMKSNEKSGQHEQSDEKPLPNYQPQYMTINAKSPGEEHTEHSPKISINQSNSSLNLDAENARYFYSIYSWQGVGLFNLPKFTHTWAIFIKLDGTDIEQDPLSFFTVSWDAADGDIGIGQPVELGHNYTLDQTYRLSDQLSRPVEIRRSKIVEISEFLYIQAAKQFNKIADGEKNQWIFYKMLDDFAGRQKIQDNIPGGYMNCQHAVADILTSPNGSLEDSFTARGFEAGDRVYSWFSKNYINADSNFEIIAKRLKLQPAFNR
jgi:hypothetical protein